VTFAAALRGAGDRGGGVFPGFRPLRRTPPWATVVSSLREEGPNGEQSKVLGSVREQS
jgi:hypothetical protein